MLTCQANILIVNIPYRILVQIIIAIFTIYSLIGQDIRILAFQKPADFSFNIITIITITFFTIQTILSCIIYKTYILSFFFWLDIVSTLSLILDIVEIRSIISHWSVFTGGAKATRVATRATRIIRLIRLFKLYKTSLNSQQQMQIKMTKTKKRTFVNRRQRDSNIQSMQQNVILQSGGNINNQREIPQKINQNQNKMQQIKDQRESRVSRLLSDLTIKKVIVIILLLMFVVPLLDSDNYYPQPHPVQYIAKLLNHNPSQKLAQNLISQYQNNQISLVFIKMNDFTWDNGVEDIRFEDIDNWQSNNVQVKMNSRQINRVQAGLSLGRTIFITVLLAITLYFLKKDTQQMIIDPIQRMIQRIKQIAKRPSDVHKFDLLQQKKNSFQTIIVQNAIFKIFSLLSLVFGQAGASIIGSNISNVDDVSAIVKGKKKLAIYGFCDIRNFTDVTQALQQDVMIFVNHIASIVHTAVDRYGGSANKNIGDAFLLVWPIPQQKYRSDKKGFTIQSPQYLNIMADFSLLSFIKIMIKLNKDHRILQYREDERLIERIGNHYRVKMGFGLHFGWGIQGAIGSQFKIDASYLSPNVNMASRLEAATKQYGVPILFSSQLYKNLSSSMKRYTRQIDRVTVKGSLKPIGLHTVDIVNKLNQDIYNLSPSANPQQKYSGKQQDYFTPQQKKGLMMDFFDNLDEYDVNQIINGKKQFKQAIGNVDQEYNARFSQGFKAYIEGKWEIAREMYLTYQQIRIM